MKYTTIFDYKKQLDLQLSEWALIAKLMQQKKSVFIFRLIAGIFFFAISGVLFALYGIILGNQSGVLVGAVISLIVGVAVLSGIFFATIQNNKKGKLQLNAAAVFIEKQYADFIGKKVDLTIEISDDRINVCYSDANGEKRKLSAMIAECRANRFENCLTIDFDENNNYCFQEDEFTKDEFKALNKLLKSKAAEYSEIAKDEHGNYYDASENNSNYVKH